MTIASPAAQSSTSRWIIALDTGGTFTDVVALTPTGEVRRVKVPSDGSLSASVDEFVAADVRMTPAAQLVFPDGFLDGWLLTALDSLGVELRATIVHQRGHSLTLSSPLALAAGCALRFTRDASALDAATLDAPRLALHILTATALDKPLPPLEVRLSTTRGTNALLEGRGARVGVLVSAGLEGVVEIGDQTRRDLFARVPAPREPIASAVVALEERMTARGELLREANDEGVREAAAQLVRDGCDSIVVSLAHAIADPSREESISRMLNAHGLHAISAVSVAPHPRLLTRTETACVHARIEPILNAFVTDATRSAVNARAFVFTSAGALHHADRFLARDTLMSGPAGGAGAVSAIARRHGLAKVVGFDMGGTSSDVTRACDGKVALRAESRVARATVAAPSRAIDSVAAGGGSMCRVRDGVCEVGPDSAGANPGPACYGRGGPLTISDVNLLAGRFVSGFLSMALDARPARELVTHHARARGTTELALIEAFLDIANARMALAIENLCVRDGVDTEGHTLIAFGGAGGQHACPLAERLNFDGIIFPRCAGFLSAQGVLEANQARIIVKPMLCLLDGSDATLANTRTHALNEARAALREDGCTDDPMRECATVTVALRLLGQEASIEVPFADVAQLHCSFSERFQQLYGYPPPPRAVEIDQLRACVEVQGEPIPRSVQLLNAPTNAVSERSVAMHSNGHLVQAPVFVRSTLATGQCITGPALIVDVGETVVLDTHWTACVHDSGDLVASRTVALAPRDSTAAAEIFAARLESIALGMGHVLERTALSPNIRDRLDFSCAVLDADGTLVQNAPHLPVHLGALGVCVRSVARTLDLEQDDIAVTNHPAFGGSHLPDVTTVAPVFIDGARVAYVAVRAHHAEIGGTRPGSFPPDAHTLAEEGVVLAPWKVVKRGELDVSEARARFASGAFPSRNPDENLADLAAQIAASRHGVHAVMALVNSCGVTEFQTRCARELDRAERALRRSVRAWPHTERIATRHLDDGSAISVRITKRDDTLHVDFTGSAPVHRANFNAPRAVTQAATLYALRLLIDEPIAMNEGLLRAITLTLPEGLLNPPFDADPSRCPPVVAGNVETSQSVVAALLEALDFCAESQSTMNNVLFGNSRFSIYETLGGGAGAGERAIGASAVHVHMSNTRLTDIDVLERRAPVLIRAFQVRRNSAGAGESRGGDGIIRTYEFLEPVQLSFFGSRRMHAPQGAHGGESGACGRETIVVGGATHELSGGVHSLELNAHDSFTVETPGGGGFGARDSTTARA